MLADVKGAKAQVVQFVGQSKHFRAPLSVTGLVLRLKNWLALHRTHLPVMSMKLLLTVGVAVTLEVLKRLGQTQNPFC
jgi:hypothetical protein